MLTTEAIKYAKEDGTTYTSAFGDYSTKDGFEFNEYGKKCVVSDPDKFITMLFSDNTVWAAKPTKKQMSKGEIMKALYNSMTEDEIKDKLGYDFEVVSKSQTQEKPKVVTKSYTLSELLNDIDEILGGRGK